MWRPALRQDKSTRGALLIALGAFAACGSAAAQTPEQFYKGRTLTLILGFPPGGGFDVNLRVLSRHIGKFIPGHPTVVMTNMPGAGSLTAANYLAASAPADGTALGMFSSSAAMEPILGNASATFDPLRFNWIGSMSQDVAYCGLWQKPGVPTNFEQMFTTETLIGAGGTAALTYQHPMVIKNTLGAKIKVVNGYAGTRDINLAMNRGEVNGTCGLFTSSILSQWPNEVKSGQMKLVVQMGATKSDVFGQIPSVFDYAKTDEQKSILDIVFGQLLFARPVVAPPGVPADRVMVLRKAFFDTLADPDFRTEAHKLGVDVEPIRPDDILALLSRYAAMPLGIRKKALAATGR